MYLMNIFEQVYLQIINESFSNNPFDSLNSDDFLKAYKYNDFPEGEDIDITDKFKKYYLDEFNSIILTDHGIKSEDNYKGIKSIHGINYMNIPKERFYKNIAFCLDKIYINRHKYNINYQERDILFKIKDNILKQEYSIVITSKPIKNSDDFNAEIKTIFYSKFSNEEKLSIKHSDKGWIKECPTFSYILTESKNIKILTFYLNLLD